jgi:phage-related baseplate assembly protein
MDNEIKNKIDNMIKIDLSKYNEDDSIVKYDEEKKQLTIKLNKYDVIKNYQAKEYVFSRFILKAEKEDLLNITQSKEYLELLDAVYKLNSIGLTVEKVSKKEW